MEKNTRKLRSFKKNGCPTLRNWYLKLGIVLIVCSQWKKYCKKMLKMFCYWKSTFFFIFLFFAIFSAPCTCWRPSHLWYYLESCICSISKVFSLFFLKILPIFLKTIFMLEILSILKFIQHFHWTPALKKPP